MILTGGDVTQYEKLQKMTMEDYITKLEHHASRTEAERESLQRMKTKRK